MCFILFLCVYICYSNIRNLYVMIITDKIIEIIKAKCFSETGLTNIATDNDYGTLSEIVAEKTGYAPVGINTWKRIFGHLLKSDGSRYDTSVKTAKVIAEFLDCVSWEQLCEYEDHLYVRWTKKGGLNNDSVVIRPLNDDISILIASLKKDDVVEVRSRPNKVLRLKFLSATADSRWYRIIDTVGSSNLQNLDEIEIPFLRMNQPLVASQLKRKGLCLGGYSAGCKQVVYSVEKIKK